MKEPTELPPILTGDEGNQIRQLRDYLVRLAQRPEEATAGSSEDSGERIATAEEDISSLNVRVKGLDERISGLWNTIYPVGAIYISTASTSPASLFGGTWERITGRFLLAATDNGANGGNSNASIKAGYTGGEATHKLTTSEMPKHSHSYQLYQSAGPNAAHWGTSEHVNKTWAYQATTTAGSDGAHNTMPPYLAVYVWKRTA